MVFASRPAAVADGSAGSSTPARRRGGSPERGGRGRRRPLVFSPSRRRTPRDSSPLRSALAGSPCGRGRRGSMGVVRGQHAAVAPVDLCPAPPVGVFEPTAFPSSSSSPLPIAASALDFPNSRPPSLPILTAADRLRRRREIRQGKRPVGSSSALRSPQAVSSSLRPAFFGGRVSVPYTFFYPTPAVRFVPRVSRADAASNRRKRRFVVLSLRGKAPVCVKGPPFSDEDIAWLKATEPTRSYYGGPEFACPHCPAVYWSAERCKRKSVSKGKPPVYNRCCRAGKISLPGFHDWPEPLRELLRFDGGALSSHFLRLIRHYNSLFCFTSMGANIDHNVGGASYVFKMCGVVFHRIGTFLPIDDRDPQFA